MARKYNLISELYDRTCKTVVANPQNWQNFLQSACRNYKLRYDEQLLIYAQRPDATAVLEIERWNRNFGRWVNRGARGIAVFADEDRKTQRLSHYFDISDTHEGRYSRPVPLWAMQEEYTEAVIETLENTFGQLTYKSVLSDAVMSAAQNAAEDNLPDYLQDLLYVADNSFLAGLDEGMITTIYKKLVTNSVAYMMMARLGINVGEYFEAEDFRDVTNFNTQETLNALGFATSDIAEMGLSEISKTIRALSRNNRIIEADRQSGYNRDENTTERSGKNERDHIHDGRGLQPSGSDLARTAGAGGGQMVTDEENISQRTAQSPVLQSPDERNPDKTFVGSTAEGKRTGGNTGAGDGSQGGTDRTDESGRHDELGSADEQHQELGSGDRENSSVRKYIAQRADLLGAIRFPNNTFKDNAGTEVVSDILFLQKRDRLIDIEPDWVQLRTNDDGFTMNAYFVQHPEMILGEMKMVSGRFGEEATCLPFENADLSELLSEAVANIHGEVRDYEVEDELEEEDRSIPANPEVRNFSYTVVEDNIYFRENSRMNPVEVSATAENRIKGLIAVRDCVRNLIELQTEGYPDEDIRAEQIRLNTLYDNYTKKYGLINSRANISAFSDDSSFALLSALEVLNENGELERKADMFFKRTIQPHKPVTKVDTASDALAVSMGEKAGIDMEYMQELSGKSEETLCQDLKGVIFLNPLYGYGNVTEPKYLMADEYLSGNVREKLALAKRTAMLYPEDYKINVEALEKVQPKDLTASEISVRLGATWVPPEIYQQFMFEFLNTPNYAQWRIKVHYSPYTGGWNIEEKSYDRGNVKANSTYGTGRINAYKIIEETLNLKDVRIFDYIEDDEGKRKAVLNKKETAIAQAKQELIKQGFQDWVWADPERREKLTRLYNEKFNSVRPREYDGSHIIFSGMNPEIILREHQRNAVAHILYGGNTLLAHAVGAGKTFEMVAASQELKRLGLCNKSLFVVPNHLTEQWAAEYLQLYPSANILVATKKDFETKNRKRFCGRIATGDYDAVIIGHSQFEKIPMSIERQRAILEQQIEELTNGIAELKENRGERFSIKQLERSKKSVTQKLAKLNDQSRKDDVVTFEELGVDRLFIDESHYYKNLFLYTKMRNVGGIAQTEAQKSSDLFMKCRYLDEITGGRGTVFATGTPISNSMVELYTIQRYLQYNTLVKNNLQHFDAWASTFGETVTAIELTPEGYTLVRR